MGRDPQGDDADDAGGGQSFDLVKEAPRLVVAPIASTPGGTGVSLPLVMAGKDGRPAAWVDPWGVAGPRLKVARPVSNSEVVPTLPVVAGNAGRPAAAFVVDLSVVVVGRTPPRLAPRVSTPVVAVPVPALAGKDGRPAAAAVDLTEVS